MYSTQSGEEISDLHLSSYWLSEASQLPAMAAEYPSAEA